MRVAGAVRGTMLSPDPGTLAANVRAAAQRLRDCVLATPTVPAPWLSQELGCEVRFKLENVQLSGSFKLRGASHALLQLPPALRAAGVVLGLPDQPAPTPTAWLAAALPAWAGIIAAFAPKENP